MIIGIGTDLVHIPRMEALLAKHGPKIAERILSEEEFASFQQSKQQAAFLAKRFAAKEAAAKALGTGFRNGLSLRHIAVRNNVEGKPELVFLDYGLNCLRQCGATRSMLSLSDEHEYAVAYVVLTE